VPVLKLLEGERGALQELESAHRKRVTPLLEIHPPRWKRTVEDKKKAKRQQTLEEVLNKVGPNLAKALADGRAFIDGLHLPPAAKMASGQHPLAYAMQEARRAEVQLIPATGPERAPQYQETVKAAVAADKLGVCIRLRQKELFDSEMGGRLQAVLKAVGAVPEVADLVLDVGQIHADDVTALSTSITVVLAKLPHVKKWRTITLASGAFPQKIGHIKVMEKVPRADWLLWQSIVTHAENLVRLPAYGDYSAQCTEPATPEATMHMGSANIRYTAKDHWLVLRGLGLRQHGYEQYHELAKHIMRQECYTGRTFCWGDEYIFNCAGGAERSGSQSTWRKVATSHHIAQVLRQLTTRRAT
jgi:hypothetical protein